MRRLIALSVLVLVGCMPSSLRFQVRVSDALPGGEIKADGQLHRVEVFCPDATRAIRPDTVEWRYEGVFAPGSEPGSFLVKAPGNGTVTAAFTAGERQALTVALRAIPAAAARTPTPPTPAPTLVPATPAPRTPEPAFTPEPEVMLNPESLVLDAYKYVDAGDYWSAICNLLLVEDPDWQPKVRSLLVAWSDRAVDQGLALARQQLRADNRPGAVQTLQAIARLNRKPPQRQIERALRAQAGL